MKHDSAVRHVSGSAVYVDDIREPEGTLHIAPGGAPVARGRIKVLDLDAVRAAPGVVAVLTAADIPGVNDVSPVKGDDPMFAENSVEFQGQVIFAVVAADARRRAPRSEARADRDRGGAADRHRRSGAGAAIRPSLPDYTFAKGDCAKALAASPQRCPARCGSAGRNISISKARSAFAVPNESDLLVYSSTQHPSELQHLIAHMLDVPAGGDHRRGAAHGRRLRRQGDPGRAMGGDRRARRDQDRPALQAAARPRRRHDLTGKRHDFRADYTVGFDGEGKITAFDVSLASRCGYSADLSGAINDRAMFHADNAYYLPAAHIVTRRMKTNTVSNTAFRGFGGPQGMMAVRARDR